MATLQQFREGVGEAWDNLVEGWQRLSRRAAGALTRYKPGRKQKRRGGRLAERNVGWGLLATEVFDDDDRVVVQVEAPGMKRGDFDLRVVGNHLIVSGEKKLRNERTEGRYRISECAYGRFERAIPLPAEVDAESANARYKKGVLRVELPKRAGAPKPRISVEDKS